jgi:hypothetical protein
MKGGDLETLNGRGSCTVLLEEGLEVYRAVGSL